MSPRLLSLLSLIEEALATGAALPAATRTADYGAGLASLCLGDGSGRISLQNFTLADGQLCVRVDLFRADAEGPVSLSIYPREAADWRLGAERVAAEWSRRPAAVEQPEPALSA